MEKLLHERLRDYKCSQDAIAINGVRHDSLLYGEAHDIAEEIVRDYIPRSEHKAEIERIIEAKGERFIKLPCDDKGNPWKVGDPVINHLGHESHITSFKWDGGQWWICSCLTGEDNWAVSDVESCKRLAHKVYDADDVEIKAGDTVWNFEGVKGTVKGINKSIANSVYIEWDDGKWSPSVLSDRLTHREPDSLERLRDDMANHWSKSISVADSMAFHEWADRLTALIERGAK